MCDFNRLSFCENDMCYVYMESEAEYPFYKWSEKKEEERAACIIERERKK